MPKLAFLFPGQGAQYVGMAQQLCDTLPAARKLFDEAASILGYDLLDVCAKGPKDRLDSTVVSQPAIYVASLAALESLRAQQPGVEADCIATAGLSLGEYTALAFAGVLTFADGLKLVKTRGEAMQAAATRPPAAWSASCCLPLDKVEELCVKARSAGTMQIANLLCPGNIVVSGTKAACDEIEKLAAEAGDEDEASGGRRRVPHRHHEARGPDARRRAGQGVAASRAAAGLVERRCEAAHRSRRSPRLARASGDSAGAMGNDDARPARRSASKSSTRSARSACSPVC